MPSFLTRAAAPTRAFTRAFSASAARPRARITIVGNLAATPEVRSTSTGRDLIEYAVASNSGPKDKRITSWFRVVCFSDGEGPRRDYLTSLPKGYVSPKTPLVLPPPQTQNLPLPLYISLVPSFLFGPSFRGPTPRFPHSSPCIQETRVGKGAACSSGRGEGGGGEGGGRKEAKHQTPKDQRLTDQSPTHSATVYVEGDAIMKSYEDNEGKTRTALSIYQSECP